MRTFRVAVSRVNGGSGGRAMAVPPVCAQTSASLGRAANQGRPSRQNLSGLSNNSLDDFRRCGNILDQVHALASPDHARAKVVRRRRQVDLLLPLLLGRQCLLTTIPLRRERISQGPPRIALWPWCPTNDIKHTSLFCLIAARCQGRGFHRLIPQGFARRGEASAHRDPSSAKGQRGCEATTISDSTRRDNRYWGDGVDYGGYKSHRAPYRRRVAASITALGDDDISACSRCFLGLRQRLHLTNNFTAGLADAAGERGRVTERQHHRSGFRLERDVQSRRIVLKRPKDEANSHARIAGLCQLSPDGAGVGISRSHEAKAASIRDGSSKTSSRGRAHRGEQYRMLDSEQAR